MSNSCYQLSNGHTVAAPIYEQVMSQIAHLREQNLPAELLLLLLKLKAEAEHHHTSLEEMLKVLQPEEFWSATGQFTSNDYLEVILDFRCHWGSLFLYSCRPIATTDSVRL